MEELIAHVETLARQKTDGHYTVLKFTTHYKAFLGTPDLDWGLERSKVHDMPAFPTLREALESLLQTELNIYELQDDE